MRAKSLMILGTASGVGKTFVTAGFCRLLSNAGYRVAPFKAQNMSNNSWVTDEGGEMGRAQVVQAECARIQPHVDMNPVLLKPSADQTSQVIVQGFSVGNFSARDYFSNQQAKLFEKVRESFERLADQNDFVILEGAGSPAEVNLKARDFVNMKSAEMADAVCLLVADIDRGGVFASVIGTLELLEPHERARIQGIIINKFRGDVSLFEEGKTFIEKRTGIPVLGILPYDPYLWMLEEDSVSVEHSQALSSPESFARLAGPLRRSFSEVSRRVGDPEMDFSLRGNDNKFLDIAVIYLPRISNFTDFEVFRLEPGVRLRYIRKAEEIENPDLLILPGTKATIDDFHYLGEKGFIPEIQNYVQRGGRLLGICGGFQMLGTRVCDGAHLESEIQECSGLGLFHMSTEFFPEKILKRVETRMGARIFGLEIEAPVQAYEIHMGRTVFHKAYQPFGTEGIVSDSGKIAGTYLHGLFDSTEFRHAFLRALAVSSGKSFVPALDAKPLAQSKSENYDRLAELLWTHLDLSVVKKLLGCENINFFGEDK